MPDFNTFDLKSGRIVKSDGSVISVGDALETINTVKNAFISMDSFRAAVVDGNAYKMSFADTTGIPAGTSYYYWVKNTSTTKSIWLRPISFNSGTLMIRAIQNGIFQVGGVTYNPDDYIDISVSGTTTNGSPTVTGTFDTAKIKAGMSITAPFLPTRTFVAAVTSSQIAMTKNATITGTTTLTISLPSMVSRNLNGNYLSNQSALKIWYQGVLGTITYADSAVDQIYNVTDYEMQEPDPSQDANEMDILEPGTEFMVALTNYGASKIPYKLAAKWAEI